MRSHWLGLVLVAGLFSSAQVQAASMVSVCTQNAPGSSRCDPVNNANPLPVTGGGGGGGGGGTSSNFGTTFPAAGTAIGLTDGTNMIGWSATSNFGTAPSAIAVPAVNAFITNITARAQGSTTSGQTGFLDMGAVTTGAPTYTTGQTSPLSLDTAGNLRVNVVTGGGGGGGTSSNFGSAFPTAGTAIGLTNGTNMVAWSATSNYGTSPGAIAVPSVNAFVTNSIVGLAQGSTTSGQTGSLTLGAVTTGAPTYTTAQTSPLSLDTAGNLRVNVVTGGGSGGTSSTFGSAFPTVGTAIGLTNGTNMVAWSATSNYGTAPSAIAVPAVNAFVTGAVGVAQAATTSGLTGSMVMGSVTTSAPTYTTAQTDPVSLDTSGNLRVVTPAPADPCASSLKTNVPIATASGTTALVAAVSAKKIYVCSFSVVAPTAVSVSLSEGSGASCGTSNQAGVIGVATNGTAANGMALTANGGLALGSGSGTVASTATANNTLCLFQSGTAQLAGNITYVQQ